MFIVPDLKQVLNYPSLRRGLLCEDTFREVHRGVAYKFRTYVSADKFPNEITRLRSTIQRARNFKSWRYRWFRCTRKCRASLTRLLVRAQFVAAINARVNPSRRSTGKFVTSNWCRGVCCAFKVNSIPTGLHRLYVPITMANRDTSASSRPHSCNFSRSPTHVC